MAAQVSFFDIAPGLTGFCSGTGETRPVCGAWRLPKSDDDFALIGSTFERLIETHIQAFRPTSIGYESPLMAPTDRLHVVRKIYGLGFLLETIAARHGIPVFERDHRDLKKELTGRHDATKDDMIEVALLCGIDLPATKDEGRGDAADAFAGWKIGIRELNPRFSERWDRIIWSKGRGGLL